MRELICAWRRRRSGRAGPGSGRGTGPARGRRRRRRPWRRAAPGVGVGRSGASPTEQLEREALGDGVDQAVAVPEVAVEDRLGDPARLASCSIVAPGPIPRMASMASSRSCASAGRPPVVTFGDACVRWWSPHEKVQPVEPPVGLFVSPIILVTSSQGGETHQGSGGGQQPVDGFSRRSSAPLLPGPARRPRWPPRARTGGRAALRASVMRRSARTR